MPTTGPTYCTHHIIHAQCLVIHTATKPKTQHTTDHIPQQNMSLSPPPLPLPLLPPRLATVATGAPPRRAPDDDNDDKEMTVRGAVFCIC